MKIGPLFKNVCIGEPGAKPGKGRRVLWLNDAGMVVTILLEGRFAWPTYEPIGPLLLALKAGNLETYRFSATFGLSAPREASLRAIEEVWTTIQSLPELRNSVPNLRTLRAEIKGVSSARKLRAETVLKWVRRWWQNGQNKDGLRPLHCHAGAPKDRPRKTNATILGRPPRSTPETKIRRSLHEGDWENFEKGIHKYYRCPANKQNSLRLTYHEIITNYYPNSFLGLKDRKAGMECSAPTYSQFHTYFYATRTTKAERKRSKSSGIHFDTHHRSSVGSTRENVYGPGRTYQLDSTPLDLHGLDKDRKKLVGRATLYLVIDVATSLIVSWWVSLEHASYLVASIALLGCLENRREVHERLGVPYDDRLPDTFGLCDTLVVDNQEVLTAAGDRLRHLGITGCFVREYRGDDKAVVEATHGFAKRMLRRCPGGIELNAPAEGSDPRRKACLNIDDIRKLIGEQIIALNTRFIKNFPRLPWMMELNVVPRPCELWKTGIARFGTNLIHVDYNEAAWHLLPEAINSSSDHSGVHVQAARCTDIRYELPAGMNPDLSIRGPRRQVEVRYDPKLIDHIFLREIGKPEIHVCSLSPHSSGYFGMSWEQAAEDKGHLFDHLVQSGLREQQDFAARSGRIRDTIDNAKAEAASNSDQSHAANLRGIKDAREADCRERRAQEPIVRPAENYSEDDDQFFDTSTLSADDDYAAFKRQLQNT